MNNCTDAGPANITSGAPFNATATVLVTLCPTPTDPAAASTTPFLSAAWTIVAPGLAAASSVLTSARKAYTACRPAFQISKHVYSGTQWVKARMHKRITETKRVPRSATGKAVVVKPRISRRRGRKSVLNYQSRTIVGLSSAAQQRNHGGSPFSLGALQETMSDQQEFFGPMGPRSTEFTKASLRAMNREGLVRYSSRLDEIEVPDQTRKKMRAMRKEVAEAQFDSPEEHHLQLAKTLCKDLSPTKKTKANLENEIEELKNRFGVPLGPSRLWQTASVSTISTDASDYQRDVDMEDIPEVDEDVDSAPTQDGERAASAAPTELVPTPPASPRAAPATPRPVLGSPTPQLSYASFGHAQPECQAASGSGLQARASAQAAYPTPVSPEHERRSSAPVHSSSPPSSPTPRVLERRNTVREEFGQLREVTHIQPVEHGQGLPRGASVISASQMHFGSGSTSDPSGIAANLRRLQAHIDAETDTIARQVVNLDTQHRAVHAENNKLRIEYNEVRDENGQLRINKEKVQADYDMARQDLEAERTTASGLRVRVDELDSLVRSGALTQEALEQQLQGLQRDYQASQAEVEVLREQLAQRDMRIRVLEDQIHDLEAAMLTTQGHIRARDAECVRLRAAGAGFTAQLQVKEEALRVAREELYAKARAYDVLYDQLAEAARDREHYKVLLLGINQMPVV